MLAIIAAVIVIVAISVIFIKWSQAKRRRTPSLVLGREMAAARRAEQDRHPVERPKEIAGRDGPEPTRYGDWEISGLTSDF